MEAGRLPRARLEPPAVRAIVRERVDRRLDRAWEVPLTVVVGPAGAGKTTAVSHLVQRSRDPAVWYRAHPVDSDETVFCEHLGQAVAHRTGEHGRWSALSEFAVDVERTHPETPLLVVIDEFDALVGTRSEQALAAAVEDLPPLVHVVTLSRHRPGFNVTRLRLRDDICEIGPDDLRFRSWEVERLFSELYGRPLPPDEVAELERRTGGWVAALQLFNLATSTLPAVERRAAIAHVGRRAGPDWDYLAENVLSGLPDELQLFLLETATFERMTADLCDELRAAHDSWRHLEDLERLQLVTSSMEAPGSFRPHEVLRAHLDGLLREWEGSDAVHKRYRRAAETLERHEQFADAVLAYCRGEDWESVGRLLGDRGAEVAARPGSWLVSLPTPLVQTDPWLLLAVARQQRADGRVSDAIATFHTVERNALTSQPVLTARRERLLLASLVDRSSHPSLAWVAALREAAFGDPLAAVAAVGSRSAHDLLAAGVARLVAADVRGADEALRTARNHPDASPTVGLAASIALLVAAHLDASATPAHADELERTASALDVPFLSRLARAAAGLVTGSLEQVEGVVGECERAGDEAGAAVAATLATLAAVWSGSGVAQVDALGRTRRLGLRTLESWVTVAEALAGRPESDVAAAEAVARRRGTRPLHDLSLVASAIAGQSGRVDIAALVERLRVDHDIVLPPAVWERRSATGRTGTPECAVQCLGGFRITVDGRSIDLEPLRPRARTVLRMLALDVGNGVHRETLYEQLWPTDDEASAAKKLQVAISSIRRVLDDAADLLRRRGDVYVLDADEAVCDVYRISAAVAGGRAALGRSDPTAAAAAFRVALELHRGDLLPEEGAADWVVGRRLTVQSDVVEAATRLGEILLDGGDAGEAVRACRAGLAVDRYSDPLWRLLLRALDADHDTAGHARALQQYDAVLAELGIAQQPGG